MKPSHEFKDKTVSGEVNVRLRWIANSTGHADAALDAGLTIAVSLHGIGISVIEATATKLPRELMHVLLEDITVDYEQQGPDELARLRLKSMQIDNQLITSMHPVVFAHSKTPVEAKSGSLEDSGTLQTKPMLEICIDKLNANPFLLHVRYFTLLLQEIDLVAEEDFLMLLAQWIEDLPLEKLKSSKRETLETRNFREIDRFLKKLMRSRDLSEEFTESHNHGQRCYLEVLHIHPIKVNITLLASPAIDSDGRSKRFRTASAMGINMLDLTNVPLKINAMVMKNAFMRPREVVAEIVRHIKWQVSVL